MRGLLINKADHSSINTSGSFEDYIDKANAAQTKEELFEVYSKTVAKHGLDKVLLCLATDHRDIGEIQGMKFMHSYPGDWMTYYFDKQLDKIDPVMMYSFTQHGSYLWDDISKNMPLTKQQQSCLDMGREAGLHNGICTPLRGPNHAVAGLSLASSAKKDSFDGQIDMITAYSNHFYISYRRLGNKAAGERSQVQNFALTNKEREVLTWMARGKSYYEISVIMNVTEHTIAFHVTNIYKKLDVHTNVMAVAKAMAFGLIHP